MSAYRLLLETSQRMPLAALHGPHDFAMRRLSEGRRNARDLMPAVADLLAASGITARDLTSIIVGLGPGSYTGLRVGVMTAKTLAYATGCPLVGVPSFHVLARQAGEDDVEVIADAQKDAVYHQTFRRGVPAGELRIVSVPQWLAERDPAVLVTGPGLAKVTADVRRAREFAWMPSPDALLAAGLETPPADPFTLVPLYLRPSSAEQQWDARR